MKLPAVLYSRDIDNILSIIVTELQKNRDVSELIEYIEKTPDLKLKTLEFLVRDILDKSLLITIRELKGQYDIDDQYFRNFPSLDDLVYHDNGWTLHNSIKGHYEAYNKWRKKENLINSLLNIIATEIQRLPHTTFDVLVRELELYTYIIIYGEHACSDEELAPPENKICEKHCGHYKVENENYTLPPYHFAQIKQRISDGTLVHAKGCKCEYAYYDDPKNVKSLSDEYNIHNKRW